MPTWLIKRCSTGLGRHLAQAVLEGGWNAVVTARDPAKVQDIVAAYPDTALALALDVTDRTHVAEAVRQAETTFGTVDVLVNNAGHGYRAAVEEADEADVDELFGANFFGPAQVIIKAVEASDPPHLLLLGSDAIQVVGAALDADRAALGGIFLLKGSSGAAREFERSMSSNTLIGVRTKRRTISSSLTLYFW